jgi:hypothetical protein
VPVSDVVRFQDLYGEDLPLAWDVEVGALVYAQLAAAVRAFFRNGGRRAWIVRVAGDGAEANRFALPGMLRVSENGVNGVGAVARSPGAWSDTLGVATGLLQQPLVPTALRRSAWGEWRITVRDARAQVNAGDVLQFTFAAGATTYLYVREVESRGAGVAVLRGAEQGFRAAALETVWPRSEAAQPSVSLLEGDREIPLTVVPWRPAIGSLPTGGRAGFYIDREQAARVRPGSWIRLRYATPATTPPHTDLLLQVVQQSGAAHLPMSPPARGDVFLITATRGWWVGLAPSAAPADALAAAIVSVEILARDGSAGMHRLAGLGLTPIHPRWWAHLPTDETLFVPSDRPQTNQAAALWREASEPVRFPLAASSTIDLVSPPPPDTYFDVPLGVPALPRADFFQPASHSGRTTDERNGLARFDPDLFLDRDLRASTVTTLDSDAFAARYHGPEPRPLRRSHVLLDIPEATLIAAPDAIHTPWHRTAVTRAFVEAPTLSVAAPDSTGRYQLTWTVIPNARYILHESPDPRMTGAVPIETDATVLQREPVPKCQVRSYRVRAVTAHGSSPWSNTVAVSPVGAAFEPCVATGVLEPPRLMLAPPLGGQHTLVWNGAAVGRVFTLELSADPLFSAARPIYQGPLTRFSIWATRDIAYFRVAAEQAGQRGPWSNTVWDRTQVRLQGSGGRGSLSALAPADLPELETGLEILDTAATQRLLRVHYALAAIAASRGDLLALLTLPKDARAEHALAYRAALAAAVAADDRMLSHVALFHPWIVLGEQPDDRLRTTAPDGMAAGVIARRTLASGGWTSPANQAWIGVLAVEPALSPADRDAMRAAGINVVAQEVRAFTTMSADTLHAEADFSEINLRLLAFLLRRLTLRAGMEFTFQPNGPALRRLIEREFDQVLGDLYMRGALAGLTRAEAYRIVTDASVNDAASIDAGRCIVELRYAPSRPLAFLTVRLVQRGSGVVLAEEVTRG